MNGHISTYTNIIKNRPIQRLPVEIITLIVDYITPDYKSTSSLSWASLMFNKIVRSIKRDIIIFDVKDYFSYATAFKPTSSCSTLIVYSSIDGNNSDSCSKRLKNLLQHVACDRLIVECNNGIRFLFSTITSNSQNIAKELVIVTDILPKVVREKRRNNILTFTDHQYMGNGTMHDHTYTLTFNKNQIPILAKDANAFYNYAYAH